MLFSSTQIMVCDSQVGAKVKNHSMKVYASVKVHVQALTNLQQNVSSDLKLLIETGTNKCDFRL